MSVNHILNPFAIPFCWLLLVVQLMTLPIEATSSFGNHMALTIPNLDGCAAVKARWFAGDIVVYPRSSISNGLRLQFHPFRKRKMSKSRPSLNHQSIRKIPLNREITNKNPWFPDYPFAGAKIFPEPRRSRCSAGDQRRG